MYYWYYKNGRNWRIGNDIKMDTGQTRKIIFTGEQDCQYLKSFDTVRAMDKAMLKIGFERKDITEKLFN